MISYFEEHKIQMDNIQVVGTDGEVTNTGWKVRHVNYGEGQGVGQSL